MSVVVVGAGLGGLRTCETLRSKGYTEQVTLVGAEPHPPYSRPPLSKEVLRGDADPMSTVLRGADEIAALGIDVQLGRRAVSLDAAARTVELDDGTRLTADHVVVATGATPRRLPGTALAGVHVLRTIDDATQLRDDLVDGARVVVVGAGFIGLEVAATAVGRGCTVTVVDPLAAPLARVLDPHVGAAVAELHAAHGVDVRCGVGVRAVDGDSRVESVQLDDGSALAADVVVVGIGVLPEIGWLTDAGLELGSGLRCDATLQAAPGIWAVGDVCEWWVDALGAHTRVEHWTNAAEQATHVALGILDGPTPFETVPYFWSDQYDAKLQVLGFAANADELTVVRGALEEPKWVALLRRGDRLTGVAGLRSAGQVMRLRPLVAAAPPWDEALTAAAPA